MSSAWIETLEPDGTLRTKWDEAAGVHLVAPLPRPTKRWRRETASSPFVDGEHETHSSLDGMQQPMTLEVFGATWQEREALVDALDADINATHALQLRIVLNGVTKTYRAYRPDMDAPDEDAETGTSRPVYLSWHLLPHPTIGMV